MWQAPTPGHLHPALDYVPDAIVVLDSSWRFVSGNASWFALVACNATELSQVSVPSILGLDPSVALEILAWSAEFGTWRGELEVRRVTGSLIPVDAVVATIPGSGEPLFLATLRDMTSRREQDQKQNQFISTITHEIRHPLTAIRGLAQLMLRRNEYDPKSLEIMISESDQLNRLLSDLFDLSHPDIRRLPLERVRTDLVAEARARVYEAQATAPLHRIGLQAPTDAVIGCWDPGRLRQIFQNLLSNAIKYSPGGGEIVVRVELRDDVAVVSVSDQGLGLSPEAVPRLFDHFYRSPSASIFEGLGLGLPLVRDLVESHGGAIWAESAGEGRGSTFRFTLPVEATELS